MISVCMAAYNGARFIREQVDSILPQLGAEDELIVSDDGSTDGTLEILAEYAAADARVKVLRHEKNPAYAKIKHSRNFYYATDNFENALRHAKGDYIFLSDQDDVWRNDKVQRMIEELQNFDLVMSNFSIIDENGQIAKEKFYAKSPVSKKLIKNIIDSNFLGSAMAFNRKALSNALPFPKKLLPHDLWIGCLNCRNGIFFDEPLHFYRRYNSNVSTTTGKSGNSFFYKIYWRISFFVKAKKRILQLKEPHNA